MQTSKWYDKPLHALARGVFTLLFTLIFPVRVQGKARYKGRTGKCLLYANHTTLLDAILVAYLMCPRKTYFMAKSSLLESNGFFTAILTSLGAVAVRRGEPDIMAMKRSLDILNHEAYFTVFPEGTRNKGCRYDLQPFQSGVGLLALRSKAPILPIYIDNHGVKPFHRIDVAVGPEIDLSDLLAHSGGRVNSETIAAATGRMQSTLQAMAVEARKASGQ